MSKVVDDIIKAEDSTLSGKVTVDAGGRTQYGIAEKYNPEAWADGKVTLDEARSIYQWKYIDAPGFNKIDNEPLRAQLIDFGVNSGPRLAIMKLQTILKVVVDGIIGPATLDAISKVDVEKLNNDLVDDRIRMIGRLVQKRTSDIKHLSGWLERALRFRI